MSDPLAAASVPFSKMQGSGNDFVLLLNDQLGLPPESMPDWARAICRRAFAVGADGLILLEAAPEEPGIDVRWHFFNNDGSRAEMCGNGARCAARLAFEAGLAPAAFTLGTDAGPVRAEVSPGTEVVKVQLTRPQGLKTGLELELDDGERLTVHFVDTGVPHAVVFSDRDDLTRLGPQLRFHQAFAPAGANVNLVQVRTRDSICLRTYERGVEQETYACGTGAAASVVVARQLGLCDQAVKVRTSGGEELDILLEPEAVYLQGQAQLIYQGNLNLGALGLSLPGPAPARSAAGQADPAGARFC
jgi:diaminopimelate epimerase